MRCQIIAELAQGFEGSPHQARLLVRAAAKAGADAAKFQMVYADELATPEYEHFALFRTLEMPDEVWAGLASYAAELGIALQLDVFGPRSLAVAERVGVEAVKLHPTDIVNAGLLRDVAASAVPQVLLGAGGALAGELDAALELLSGKEVVVLLGFQSYPTATEDNQIARLRTLGERVTRRFPRVRLGFADHASPDSELSRALAAMAIGAGATVLEKHLTLGRNMELEDHESALNPDEFAHFVAVVRGCEAALGVASDADDFGMSEAERGYRVKIRRHAVAARDLAVGVRVAPADIVLKRTAAREPLTDLASVYDRSIRRAVRANSPVLAADLE